MVPGESLGVPWGVPGGVRGAPRASRGPVGTLFGEAAKINKNSKWSGTPKVPILGPGRDPKIDQKWPQDEKYTPGNDPQIDFSPICAANAAFSRFLVDFDSIFDEKHNKKQKKIAGARVFFNLANLTKYRILQVRSHFLNFCIIAFFSKKTT